MPSSRAKGFNKVKNLRRAVSEKYGVFLLLIFTFFKWIKKQLLIITVNKMLQNTPLKQYNYKLKLMNFNYKFTEYNFININSNC